MFYGLLVLKPDVTCEDKDISIIVTISFYETIKKRFITYDENITERLFILDELFQENIDINFFEENIDKIFSCYETLEDDTSRELYITLLKYRYVRDVRMIENLYESRKNCYYDRVFLNRYKDGLYIDAGSYNADFLTNLSNLVDVSNSKFYIFEPNQIFCEKIKDYLKDQYNYKLFQCALCDVQGTMEFRGTNTSTSHLLDAKYNAYRNVLDEKIDFVKTFTLDNLLKNEKVTGIKVDIEGAEQKMIQGSVNMIKRGKPIILLSIYHQASDLVELQNFINNLNLNSKFYIRHYSLSIAKTILYCILNE